jgi:ATP-dependent Zn protease
MKNKNLRTTAFHEAAHAAIAFEVGRRVHKVSIVENEDYYGYVHIGNLPGSFQPDVQCDGRTRRLIESHVMHLLAGPIAEKKLTGRISRIGASGDYRRAVDLASYCCGSDKQAEKFIAWLWERTKDLLDEPAMWRAVEVLAAALIEKGELTGRRAKAIYLEARRSR